jgi:gliding motility-associated-like protein
MVYGLKLDRAGFPYVMGTTVGTWPVINVTFSNAGGRQFISKLQPDFSAYVYSTVFGNGQAQPNISPIAFLVDRCENVYVSGWGGGINNSQQYSTGNTRGLPKVNPLATSFAPDDGQDFYFFVLEKNGASQLFGSHFGQNNGIGDHVDGGTSRFDENGVIYQAICANCGNNVPFPTTPGVWASSNGSSNCNEAAIKIEMNFTGVAASVRPTINGQVGVSKACVPFTVYFSDTLSQGVRYYWSYGDGRTNTTNTASDTITYSVPGTYLVTLISEDSSTCNIRDTAQILIVAGNKEADPDFIFSKIPPCQNLSYEFTNTTVSSTGSSFAPNSFEWDFGDGTPPVRASFSPSVTHTFPSAGSYNVTLRLLDTSYCNVPAQIQKTIRVSSLVEADFEVPDTGCVPYAAVFENTSSGGTQFIWDFGDGTVISDPSLFVTHTYSSTGTYNVRLIAIDSNTCNIRDTSAIFVVVVINGPVAQFTWSPDPPQENTPVSFTNQSSGAVRYLWNFGDGQSSTETNPTHQYNESGDYTAELIAYNALGCTDTFRLRVSVLIKALLDIPNAFTPGRFGDNGIIKVKGFGLRNMIWRIYNRWGQLVFESNSVNVGWDGTFKGKDQPMDVYTYTLDAELFSGKKIRRTGDITLIR